MIVDEAQSGVGRTGRWSAVEHLGVVPDVITTSRSGTTTHEIAHRVQEPISRLVENVLQDDYLEHAFEEMQRRSMGRRSCRPPSS